MFSFKSPSVGIKKIIASGIIVFIILYTFFEARGLVTGPTLSITSPINGETTTTPVIYIQGMTQSISELTINGKIAAVHENGNFSNAVVLKDGYNEIVLTANDRFNREVSKTLQIIHKRLPFTTSLKSNQENHAEQKNSQED